jgi:hypothetical protein
MKVLLWPGGQDLANNSKAYRIDIYNTGSNQCCGSGMISSQIPDPAKFHSGSRILLYRKKGQIFLKCSQSFSSELK